MSRILAFLIALACSARADFDAARSYRLAPRGAALGGMSQGLEPSLEAALLDPSMLPMNYQGGLAGFAGPMDGAMLQGATASLSPWRDGAIALGWASFSDARVSGAPAESEASLSLATQGSAHSLLGLRGKWMRIEGGVLGKNVQGGALDLGAHWGWQGLFNLPVDLSLGLSALNLADTLPKDWKGALGREISASLALSLGGSLSLGAESAWQSPGGGLDPRQLVRMGAQWRALSFMALRGGWQQEGGASAGLGLDWASAGLTLDYSYLAGPSQHRAGLSWRIAGLMRPDVEVKVQEFSALPGRAARHASFGIEFKKELLAAAKNWKMDLKSADGSLVREFAGEGPPPTRVDWDGRDSKGESVDKAGEISVEFSAQLPGRKVSSRRTQNLEQAYAADSIRSFLKELSADRAPLPRLEPVFANDDSGTLSQVAIQMPSAGSTDVKGWELKIQDPSGNAVRTMKGTGAMPPGLVWDGKNDQGQAVAGAMGLRVVFSVQDRGGQAMTSMQPLLTDSSVQLAAQKAGKRPKLKLEGLSRDFFASPLEPAWSEKFLKSVSRE